MSRILLKKKIMIGVLIICINLLLLSLSAASTNDTASFGKEKVGLLRSLEKNFDMRGVNAEEIKENFVDCLLYRLMKLAHMSALAAAIVKEDKVVWTKGFGVYDRENNKKTTEETIFLAASISKTITATAVMQLYEKKLLNLDDDVNKYLPFSLRNPNYPEVPITFRMLLSHHASLATEPNYPRPTFIRMIPGDGELEHYPDPFLKEYLVPGGMHYTPRVWEDFPPGKEMRYANIGYAVLGYLVELISDQTFETYCREHIFDPLGMHNSSFRVANLNQSRLAVPYDYHAGTYYPFMHYDTVDYPASGLRSSVVDLSRFLIAYMNEGMYNTSRILKEETISLMLSPHYDSGKHYGLGWQLKSEGSEQYVGHSGGMHGVSTMMAFKPSDNVGVIYFINERVLNYREQFAFSLIKQLLFWKADAL
ncbi:MAG: serine hydrolase [Candidatus Thermoplasmatota archaeon]|nr:serine hydrolase [Candidatus Thermoplasmatota archaeon]